MQEISDNKLSSLIEIIREINSARGLRPQYYNEGGKEHHEGGSGCLMLIDQ